MSEDEEKEIEPTFTEYAFNVWNFRELKYFAPWYIFWSGAALKHFNTEKYTWRLVIIQNLYEF